MTDTLARTTRIGVFTLVALLGLTIPVIVAGRMHYISSYFVLFQDLSAAVIVAIAMLIFRTQAGRAGLAALSQAPLIKRTVNLSPKLSVTIIAIGVFTIGTAGTWAVFQNFPLAMDEFWARADGEIFATGAPMSQIPEIWRPYATALMPIFTRLLPDPGLWASTYLPVNALLQQFMGVFASPLMASLSVILCALTARQLMPEAQQAPLLAALLLASSSQVLITAMTPYAMTAHLFFNLLWLWLFLRRSIPSQLAAAIVALLAMGLHQATYFPLFALPFLFEAFLRGQWRTALAHLLLIATGFLIWSNYDVIAYAIMDAAPSESASNGSSWLFGAFIARILRFDLMSIILMGQNLLRFNLWQNPVIVPLLLLIAIPIIRTGGTVRALLAGIVFTTIFMMVVIPFQGHGWGYRYLHGLLGSASLLAVYAYYKLRPDSSEAKLRWRGLFAAMFALSLLVLLPLHALQARWQTAPYAAAHAELLGWETEIIVIDAPAHAYTIDLVRNSPLLGNTPKRLAFSKLAPGQLTALCDRYDVRLFDNADATKFGIPQWAVAESREYPSNCGF